MTGALNPLTTELLVVLGQTALLLGALMLLDRRPRASRFDIGHLTTCAAVLLLLWPVFRLVVPRTSIPLVVLPHEALLAPVAGALPMVTGERVLLMAWATGCFALLGRLLWSLVLVRRLRLDALPTSDTTTRTMLTRAMDAIGYRAHPPQLLVAAEIGSPAVCGWRRPVILLPAWFDSLSEEARYAVLCHEVAHLRRRDWLQLLAAEVVRAVYWPVPFVGAWSRRASFARELAADRAVLRAGVMPADYAKHLIHTARICLLGGSPPLVAFSTGTGPTSRALLTERVRALFLSDRASRSTGKAALPSRFVTDFAANIVVVALAVGVAVIDPLHCLPAAPATKVTTAPVSSSPAANASTAEHCPI